MIPPNGLKLYDNLGPRPSVVEDDDLRVGLQKVISKAAQVSQLLNKQRVGDLCNKMGLTDPGNAANQYVAGGVTDGRQLFGTPDRRVHVDAQVIKRWPGEGVGATA
jgi:hypothetical protein